MRGGWRGRHRPRLKPTAGQHRMRQKRKPTPWARRSAMKPQ